MEAFLTAILVFLFLVGIVAGFIVFCVLLVKAALLFLSTSFLLFIVGAAAVLVLYMLYTGDVEVD